MKPKVSVIIPVYNVEQYIERCAISLFEQTLQDLEYIFINDCTPDRSMDILQTVIEKYPKRKKQTVIINQLHNMGAAKAREVGIKAAQGEYIIHCDSDDWVDREIYETLYNKAYEEQLDMVVCDWYESDGETHQPVIQNLDLNRDMLAGTLNRSISGSLWNKLIACYIYQSVDFYPIAHMMEDVGYCVQFFHKCHKIGYINQPLYYYYSNISSICNNPEEDACIKRCKQACENIDRILQYLQSNDLSEKYSNQIVTLKNSARVFLWPLFMENPKKYYKAWSSVYPEINKQYPFTSGISPVLRLIFALSVLRIYPYIYKMVH